MFLSMGHAVHPPTHTFDRAANLPCWTLGFNVRGRAVVEAAGITHTSNGCHLNLIAPHTAYATRYGGGGVWESYWAIFPPRRDWDRRLRFPARGALPAAFGFLELRDAAVKRRITAAFKEGCDAMRSSWPQRQALALNAIERILLLADTMNPLAAHARLDPRVREAMDIMAARFDERFTVADLARLVHLSPSHFAHLFTEQVGSAPMTFLEQQRMDHARQLLLTTGDPVNAIARAVGIDNAFHFSTRFRKHVGVSPRAYRAKPV